jgi:hypothetical protein
MAQMTFAVVTYTLYGEFKMSLIEEGAYIEHGPQPYLSTDAREIEDAGVMVIVGDHDEQLPAAFTSH